MKERDSREKQGAREQKGGSSAEEKKKIVYVTQTQRKGSPALREGRREVSSTGGRKRPFRVTGEKMTSQTKRGQP